MVASPSLYQVLQAMEKGGAVIEAHDGDVECVWPNEQMARSGGIWMSLYGDTVAIILTRRDLYHRDPSISMYRHA